MSITIDQVLAKVGSQAIQIDLLTAQVAQLQAQIKDLTKKPESGSVITPAPKE